MIDCWGILVSNAILSCPVLLPNLALELLTVRNDGHVTDVGWMIHQAADLIDGEVDHVGGIEIGLGLRGSCG